MASFTGRALKQERTLGNVIEWSHQKGKTSPVVLQVPPVSPTTGVALHIPWVIFENKNKVFQAIKT